LSTKYNPSIIVADDEPDILETISDIVEAFHPHVLKANDGQEALDLFKANRISCIVSDINMPRMNGLNFLKEIRNLGHETPVIFVTAHTEKKMVIEAFRLGATDYIEKPFDIDQLLSLVKETHELGLSILDMEDELKEIVAQSKLSESKIKKFKECKKAVRLMSIENEKRRKVGSLKPEIPLIKSGNKKKN
jgi:DNA-binding NtrC family response regulator